jgi:hypothetical protein
MLIKCGDKDMSIIKDGPYLAMAVICERVLQEKDGVLSAIRIIDKITQTIAGPHAPEVFPGITLNLFALISFKSGISGGKYTIRLSPFSPSGDKLGEFSGPIFLEGNGRSANVIINLNLIVKEEGLYWFDILLEDQLVTRIPLHILYQKIQTGTEALSH